MDTVNTQITVKPLSIDQEKFLGWRFVVATDTEAAEKTGISLSAVALWKKNSPEFARRYATIGQDVLELTKRRFQGSMDKVFSVWEDLLDDKSSRIRLQAVQLALEFAGMERGRSITVNIHDKTRELLASLQQAAVEEVPQLVADPDTIDGEFSEVEEETCQDSN